MLKKGFPGTQTRYEVWKGYITHNNRLGLREETIRSERSPILEKFRFKWIPMRVGFDPRGIHSERNSIREEIRSERNTINMDSIQKKSGRGGTRFEGGRFKKRADPRENWSEPVVGVKERSTRYRIDRVMHWTTRGERLYERIC